MVKVKKTSRWNQAQNLFVGGVNSPVRAFRAMGGEPVFMRKAKGPYLFDVNKKRYVDYCLSWGALILGHSDKKVVSAIRQQAEFGTSFGTVTEYETLLAQEIKKIYPSMEKMRFTSSGTESVMSAIRVARGYTHRDRIVKFEGCYHGHSDSLLVKAGSGLATFSSPDSEGVPADLARLTEVLPYNDCQAVKNIFKIRKDIACVIVEPVAGNMGVVPATAEFLKTLRQETQKAGAVLIFDEVMSGFRVAYGGASQLYKITPDLTVLGKIIGGGLPVAAFGGKAKIMDVLSPLGKVYQAGTLSGNPLAMVAGRAVLTQLSESFYKKLNHRVLRFTSEIEAVLQKNAIAAHVHVCGSMFTIFFGSKSPKDFKDVMQCDGAVFRKLFHHMLKHGIYIPPSAFEAWFVSASHEDEQLEATLRAFAGFKP